MNPSSLIERFLIPSDLQASTVCLTDERNFAMASPVNSPVPVAVSTISAASGGPSACPVPETLIEDVTASAATAWRLAAKNQTATAVTSVNHEREVAWTCTKQFP